MTVVVMGAIRGVLSVRAVVIAAKYQLAEASHLFFMFLSTDTRLN